MVQAGSKVVVSDDGVVEDVFAVIRPVTPDRGCLSCAGIISPVRLAMEIAKSTEAKPADYGTDQPAPSVAALNAISASHAVVSSTFTDRTARHEARQPQHLPAFRDGFTDDESARSRECTTCGDLGIVGLGDLRTLRIPTSRP